MLRDPILRDNVHDFGKAGDVEHFVNFFGNISYGKMVLTECFELNKAYPQKRRGNENYPIKVKDDFRTFVVIFEFSDMAQQLLLEHRASMSIKPIRK